ncbi:MAG: phosphoribosyltransferase family protein, partial [Rickettsiales bacterium]
MAMGDAVIYNQDIIHSQNVTQEEIHAVMEKECQELKRRELAYRGNHTFPILRDKTIILVDDGIATGATMRVAIKALRQLSPARIIVAVPVADRELLETMQPLADEFICPLQPDALYAVGAWYDDFSQTEDDEVFTLLKQARHRN